MNKNFIKTYRELWTNLRNKYGTNDVPREVIETELIKELLIIRPNTIARHIMMMQTLGYIEPVNAKKTLFKMKERD